MRNPRRLADNVLASIRNFESACNCPDCQAGASCVDCASCIEELTGTIGQVLGLAGATPVAVPDRAQRSMFSAEVIEFPGEKKACHKITAPGERKA